MPLSWNEIRQRAILFAREWTDVARERSEAQTFWNEFFHLFGIRRRTVASFEAPVRTLGGHHDFIDLLWPGRLIAEHKSRGGNLDKAHTQALGYVQSLQSQNRGEEAPRYILVSDFARFARFALYNLHAGQGQACHWLSHASGEAPRCDGDDQYWASSPRPSRQPRRQLIKVGCRSRREFR